MPGLSEDLPPGRQSHRLIIPMAFPSTSLTHHRHRLPSRAEDMETWWPACLLSQSDSSETPLICEEVGWLTLPCYFRLTG